MILLSIFYLLMYHKYQFDIEKCILIFNYLGFLQLLITPLGIPHLDSLEFSQICQNGTHLEEEVTEIKVSKTVKRIAACHSLAL